MMAKRKATEPQEPVVPEAEVQQAQTEEAELAPREELRTTIDRLQRLQAEFENYRKRVARDAAFVETRATDRTILDFLPLYDNLERAFQSLAASEDTDTFVSGVEQIFGQFHQLLETRGVSRIDCIGKPFDPTQHEAMLSIPHDTEKNTIIEEFMPGYTRDGRVLQASKVSVSQGPAPKEEEE